jgi:hypothetical protein
MMFVDRISLVEIKFEELIVSNALEVLEAISNIILGLLAIYEDSIDCLRIDFLIVCINEILLGDFAEGNFRVCGLGEVPLRFQRPVVDLTD